MLQVYKVSGFEKDAGTGNRAAAWSLPVVLPQGFFRCGEKRAKRPVKEQYSIGKMIDLIDILAATKREWYG